jgi:hypothetical protein
VRFGATRLVPAACANSTGTPYEAIVAVAMSAKVGRSQQRENEVLTAAYLQRINAMLNYTLV